MADALHIDEAVITEDCISRRHGGEGEIHILKSAVITPTGWDFIRHHHLQVVRVERAALGAVARSSGVSGAERRTIREISPSADDTSLLQQGRYDFPNRPCGCKEEEFGSGFVEPSSCRDCALNGQQQSSTTTGGEGCHGCNRLLTLQSNASGAQADGAQADIEDLVQRLTEEIISRLP